MKQPPRSQRPLQEVRNGFTLLEVLVAASIFSILLMIIRFGTGGFADMSSKVLNSSNFREITKDIVEAGSHSCGWGNSLLDPSNTGFACINNSTDCANVGGESGTHAGGNFVLRDSSNQIIFENSQCPYPKDCSIQGEVKWTPACPAGVSCLNPQIKIDFTIMKKNSAGENVFPPVHRSTFAPFTGKVYSSCLDAKNADPVNNKDGFYYIDSGGADEQCGFIVHCDMTNDGGGWALVANAPSAGLNYPPVTFEPLGPHNYGILNDERLIQLIQNSTPGQNNVRINIDSAIPTTIGMSISASNISKSIYRADMDAGYSCNSYSATPLALTTRDSLSLTDVSLQSWGFVGGASPSPTTYLTNAQSGLFPRVAPNATEILSPSIAEGGFGVMFCSPRVGSTCNLSQSVCTSQQIFKAKGSMWVR